MEDNTNPMPMMEIPGQPGANLGMLNLGDLFGKAFGQRKKKKQITLIKIKF